MFQMKTFACAAALAAMAMIGSAASASTVDLISGPAGDATGDGQHAGTFSSGDISGTITAGCSYGGSDTDCDLSSASDTPKIQITSGGMGVTSDHDVADNQLDSANGGEYLTFTFDSAVTLLDIDLYGLSGSDSYDLYINGSLYADGSTADPWTTDIENVTTLTIVSLSNCNTWGCNCDTSEFKVKSFSAELYTAPVPLPAAGLMLLGALGGLGVVRRRRKA